MSIRRRSEQEEQRHDYHCQRHARKERDVHSVLPPHFGVEVLQDALGLVPVGVRKTLSEEGEQVVPDMFKFESS